MGDHVGSATREEADAPEPGSRVSEILSVGARIFAEKGFDKTSMRDIAVASGVSKALLYHHFENKDQLYAEIAYSSTDHLNKFVLDRVPATGTAAEKIRAFMIAMADFFEQHRLAWIAASTAFWSDPDRHRLATRLRRRKELEGLLRQLLQDGIDSGEFNSIDPAMTGRLILSGINWMHRWYNPERELSPAQIVDSYFETLFAGLQRRNAETCIKTPVAVAGH